jgi:hypothetical protein
MELPIVKVVNIRGTDITVRAIPVSLAERVLSAAGDGAASMRISKDVVERCCTLSDGTPPSPDLLTVQDMTMLVETTFESLPDFTPPQGG